MGCDIAGYYNKVTYNYTQTMPSDITFLVGRSSDYRAASDYAEDVIENH